MIPKPVVKLRAFPDIFKNVRKWAFNLSGYNRYGLLHDDLLIETPVVKEALKRLPRKNLEERQFRISRALYLSMKKEILPEEEWTKFEADERYLKPIADKVEKEYDEMDSWNRK